MRSLVKNGPQILLLGFFIPLYKYDRNPSSHEAKMSNVNLAFEFLTSSGIKVKNRPAEVVRGDLKAILRILYCIFVKFKGKPNEMEEQEQQWKPKWNHHQTFQSTLYSTLKAFLSVNTIFQWNNLKKEPIEDSDPNFMLISY